MAKARYKQLVDSLAGDIRSGRIAPGSALPTHRQLARQHKMALVTASRVYAELEAMGLISGEPGRGTFVKQPDISAAHGIDQPVVSSDMVDLNFNNPALPEQTQLLREALRQLSVAGDLEAILKYQPHAGRPHERLIIANYLQRQGVQAKADSLFIVSGAQHGISLALMALFRPGDVIAADSLTYSGFKAAAELFNIELVPIPILQTDEYHGPDLQALDKLCQQRDIKAIYTIPTVHNPLGWVLDRHTRTRLVEIARQYDLLILEDAAYAFLHPSPPPALINLAPERTFHITGLSKNLATGLRIGFLVAPTPQCEQSKRWYRNIERAIRATTWNTPALVTRLACQWIEDGTLEKLQQAKRQNAAQRQAIARQIFEGITLISHPASYCLWIPLGNEIRADAILAALLQQNIAVSSAEPFAISQHIPHALRIALASPKIAELEVALRAVKQVLDRFDW
ncbi:PLP-dependent aminotransferase family protein [Oceanobacter mangrovi]|uniref:aminotransferase-like domain-containing protein n=1 Tax=Oceanobacter mangrovi TaxID=2862510 RepID=UPI001C8F063F|nr:PLP-dependent aminotransferase family protein [Oceanobacter mangrovi]